MKRVDLPLAELSFSEKLDLMEVLWTELSREEYELESPAWDETVLADRDAALASGEEACSDWEEAKVRIRNECL